MLACIPRDPHREEDGRVPLASASLSFVGETRYVRGEHGSLPSVPAVYRDVFRFLREEEMELPDSPEGALSGHLAPADLECVASELHLSLSAGTTGDDPGYLQFDDPDPAVVDRLQSEVEAEAAPQFRRIRIL